MARNAVISQYCDFIGDYCQFYCQAGGGTRHSQAYFQTFFAHNEIIAEHSVIRRIANIVPAIVIMNGITTVPHFSDKAITFVQMGAQAFIFLTIALAIGELLNIFNLIYQRNPKSRNKPIKGYLQLVKLIIFIVCGLMILGTFLKKMYSPCWPVLVPWLRC